MKLTSDEGERQKLAKLSDWNEDAAGEGKDEFQDFVKDKRRTLLEVLKEFPTIEINLGQLMGMLPPNKPRFYSISSSPKVLADAASVAVSVVKGSSPTGREHLGMCSNYLKNFPSKMPRSVHPECSELLFAIIKDTGSSFRLPASSETPIIMVGPGTGVAPMRGFIQDRVAANAKENVLFFGCHDEDDFLFREELEAWKKEGFLELHVAFSRLPDQPKTYVQHLVQAEGARMVELIKRGAHIYVCGDASKMAPDVQATFEKLVSGSGLEANLIAKMITEGRYCQDVWAAQSV